MENKDYEIKMDGEFHKFKGGGIRYTKDGKGRFDLIPSNALAYLVRAIEPICNTCNVTQIFELTSTPNLLVNYSNRDFVRVIFGITLRMAYKDLSDFAIAPDGEWKSFVSMLKELAVHYQKGAAKYGENNWRKGIPQWSFEDSGFRHLCQYINGETDEPHHISSIWNMMCWLSNDLNGIYDTKDLDVDEVDII
jgi:hypothetical protein